MRKVVGFIFIFVLCCFCFSGCIDGLPAQSFQPPVTPSQPNNTSKTFSVYVCGAVENEGYVDVPEGSDYLALAEKAGVLPQTYFTQNPQTLVTEDTKVLPLDWYDGTVARSCVNVNGGYVTMRREIDGIDAVIINKIADYIALNGIITDRLQLKEILGDDYADNFYKFFVSVEDYEKAS